MIWMLAGAAFSAAQQLGAARAQPYLEKAENERIAAYNKAVATQSAKAFNEIALQKTVLADQTAQALDATQRQGLQVKAQRGLQAAGTDTMGASVDQNLLDIDQKVDNAKVVLTYNENISDASLNAQAQQVADSGAGSLRAERPVSNNWGAALGNAMATVGVALFENKTRYGTYSGATPTSRQY
jgi:hypothetical protein